MPKFLLLKCPEFWCRVKAGGAGVAGSNVLRIRASGSAGSATSDAVAVPAGRYSLSLRIGRRESTGAACNLNLVRVDTGAVLAVIPPAESTALTAYTTSSFDLPAGNLRFQLTDTCSGGEGTSAVDALVFNYAGPTIANASFATPALAGPTTSTDIPRVNNPAGSSWTYSGAAAGIQGNAGSAVTSEPRTAIGSQFGDVAGTPASISQSVMLTAGTYVVLARASSGSFNISVNGSSLPGLLRGSVQPVTTANGFTFGEVMSAPFTLTSTASVNLSFISPGLGFSLQYPRIVRLDSNPPPTASLALQVNGVTVTTTAAAGGTLVATASGSDADGVQRIRVLRDGVALAPESSATAPASAASPLSVTVSPLQMGSYQFTAEVTDHAGGVTTTTQTLNVIADATIVNGGFETPVQTAGGFTYNPTGAGWTFTGRSAIQQNGSAWGAMTAPEGIQTAVLQCSPGVTPGAIAQDIYFSNPTQIQLQFKAAWRAGYAAQPIQVTVDGVAQGAAIVPSNTTFSQYGSVTISVGSGSHSIGFTGPTCSSELASFVDDVRLVIVNNAPTITAFSVSPTLTQTVATPVALAATASDPDATGYVASIDFLVRRIGDLTDTVISGQSCSNNAASPAKPFSCSGKSWTPPAPGRYQLRARATDNQGATAVWATPVEVALCGPSVTFSSPTATTIGTSAGQAAQVVMTAQVTQASTDSACGTISSVQFFVDDMVTPKDTRTAAPYTTTQALAVGTHTLRAKVNEAGGARSATVDLPVSVVVNSPPKVDSITVVGGVAIAGQIATIQVVGSDVGGAVSQISVTVQPQGGGAATTTTCASTATCSLQWTPQAGLYTVTAAVTDDQGAVTSATQTIAVSEAPGVAELTLPTTTSTIGTTAGQFAVSESGAATYSIPITVAPGVNGIQPNLALTYNSQAGDGNLGVGWNLAGTSAITRCPKTIATDGVREAINYDNVTDPVTGNDAFCLDGQRLIPVASTLSQVDCPAIPNVTPNAKCRAWEFRTELDTYSRIIGIGDNVDPNVPGSGSGPTRFRVYTKSGQILEFGSRWWGLGAPRPDPQTSLIVNPSFEDTPLTDSCWAWGASAPSNYDWSCQGVVFPNGGPTWTGYADPQWTGGAGSHPEWGYFKTWSTGASTAGWVFGVAQNWGNSGVQRNYSAMSLSGPYTADGAQSVFIQQLGWASTVAQLDAGTYRLGVKLAGRPPGATWGGNQTIAVTVDGAVVGMLSTTSGQAFTQYYVNFTIGGNGIAAHTIRFEGQRFDDQTALLDAITLVPLNEDVYSIKVFPLDRVEDRNGNYMHIDYGGTHENQILVFPDGTVQSKPGTIQSSYGNASLPDQLPVSANARVALIAQGARPALEMYPRRFTYGMRSPNGNNGNNQSSVGGVEIARVILNYECADGTPIWSPSNPPPNPVSGGEYCRKAGGTSTAYDTGAAQLQRSRRLASVRAFVGGPDDSSTTADRDRFHSGEISLDNSAVVQCRTGSEGDSVCGLLLRSYSLRYEVSPSTQRVRMAGVTECASDGACLPETSFAWQDSTLTLQSSNGGAGTANFNDLYAYGQVADVVGDGRSRLVVYKGSRQLDVCEMSTTDGSASCTSRFMPIGFDLPDAKTANDHAWTLADIDGDAIADVLVTPKSQNGTRAFACALPAGSNTYQCAEFPPKQGVRGGTNSPDTRYYSKTGDFNGDGRIDVAFYRGNGTFEVCLAPFSAANCTLAKLNGLNIGFSNALNELNHQVVADFNGDGRADIAYRVSRLCVEQARDYYDQVNNRCNVEPTDDDMYWSVCFATGPDNAMRFECATRSAANLLGAVKTVPGKIKQIANFDFNGDGLADFASAVTVNGQTKWRVCLSTGDGEFARAPNGGGECPLWDGPSGSVEKTVAGDFNGDGRTDLAVFKSATANGVAATWEVCLSTGNGFQLPCAQIAGPPKPADCGGSCNEVFPGDFNGDGKTDLAVNGFGMSGRLYFSLPDSVMPDLITTVTTGLGAQTKIAYQPLSSTTTLRTITDSAGTRAERVYSRDRPGSIADYPDPAVDELIIQSPMYVVESTRASTGGSSSDWFKTEYRYAQLMANKVGRGLYGFRGRSVTENILTNASGSTRDDSNAVTTGYLSKNAWPNVGRPTRIAKSAATSVVDSFGNRGMQSISVVDLTYGARFRSSQVTLTGAASARNPVNGSSATTYTIYEAFQLASVQTGTDLNGAALPTTTVVTGPHAAVTEEGTETLDTYYDSFGNPKKVVTIVETASPAEKWTQTIRNFYYNNGGDTTRWLLGKLQYSVSESKATGLSVSDPNSASAPTNCVSNAGTATYATGQAVNVAGKTCRKSSFAYQTYGGTCTNARDGQLCTETVEPDAGAAGDWTLYQQTAYEYDGFGNRTKSTVSFYDDTAGTAARTRATTTTYKFGKYPNVITRTATGTDPNLAETREYTDLRCRMPSKVIDANGNYALIDYDGFCRKVREAAYTGGDNLRARQTLYSLTTSGIDASKGERYALETRSADIQHTDKRTSIQFYDNLQRVVRAQARRFDGDPTQLTTAASFATAHTFFDGLGRQRCVAKEVSGSTLTGAQTCAGQSWTITAGSAVSRFDYDSLNRVVTETTPDGATVGTLYNGLSTTVTRSNANGTAGAANSAAAHVVTKTANAKGMVATVVTAPLATTLSNYYDFLGNLSRVDSPGAGGGTLSKTMRYDVRGRQTRLSDPDAGTYNYTYNGVGEQVSQSDGTFTTTTTYDSLGRKKTRTESPGSIQTTWTYDCSNALGLLCSVSYGGAGGSASVSTTKTTVYDKYARPTTTTTDIGGAKFVSQLAYDAAGRPMYAVYPQATTATAPLAIRTRYSTLGFAYQTENAATQFIYQQIKARGADGQLLQANLGTLLTLNHGYSGDGLGRIARVNVSNGVGVAMPASGAAGLLDQTFDFESIGNLKSRTLSAPSASPARNETENFSYDALDRLIGSSGVSDGDTGSFVYDGGVAGAGNLTNKGGFSLAYVTGSNRLCGIGASSCGGSGNTGSINYDGRGNITQYTRPLNASIPGADGALITLSGYTAFNLPTAVSKSGTNSNASAAFAYDAGYQRVRQVKFDAGGTQVNDILYVVPGGFEVHRNENKQVTRVIATVSGAEGAIATVTTTFDPNTGQAQQVASVTDVSGNNTVTRILLKDHLSSMVAEFTITAGSGSVASAGSMVVHGFGPWGNARNAAAALNVDQRGFTGHEHLAELGIIHMNGRLYDPVLGRFLQADPIIQAPHNAQSHNRYAYVLNNPLSFSDPSGFSFWTKWRRPIIGLIAGIATGFAASYLTSSYLYAGLAGDVVPAATQASIATISNGVGAAAGGFASGGIMGGNIQSAVRGAFTGLLTFGAIQGLSDMMAGAGAGTASAGTAIGASTAGGDSVAQAINSTPNLPAAMQVPTSDAAVPDPNLSNHRLERIEINGSSTQVVRIGQYSGFANIWNNYVLNPASVVGVGVAGAFGVRAAASSSPWLLKPFARGQAIETSLGQNLPRNFPVIDKFENGVATSIKSLDVNAASYQSAATLSRTLGGYIDDVAAFNGRSWAGVQIAPADILARGLDLAIPNAGNAAQQLVFQQALLNAAAKSVALRILIIP